VDGIRDQVEWQCAELDRLLGPLGLTASRVLDGEARDALWWRLGGLAGRGTEDAAAVMKWGVLPTQLPGLMEQAGNIAEKNGLRAALTAHAGIGIATAVLSGGGADINAVVAALGEWRSIVKGAGGHAMIQWAPLPVKERVPVWDEPGPAMRLMKSLKVQLDPRGILNPGRFVGGI